MTYSPIIPFLRYQDVGAAVDWLCTAFGLERHDIAESDGEIFHAELTWGTGAVHLGGPFENDAVVMRSPRDLPALNQGVYLYVGEPEEVDAHYRRATEAGAKVVHEPHDTHYGAREYGVTDLEGHYWVFGSYLPR